MSDEQENTIRKYWLLMGMNASSHVIRAARDVGLLDQLTEGQKTFGELVEACDIQPDLTTRTLDVLLATGLVEQYAEYYAASQVLKLLAQYDRDFGDSYLSQIASQLRCESSPDSVEDFRRNNVARGWTRTPLAMQAAAVLDIGSARKNLKILEIGSGAGVWASAIAFRDDRSSVVAVDNADALAEARIMADSIQLGDRWTSFEADPASGELPEGPFDLVVVPELIQTMDDAMAVTILGRAADVTREGGDVVVIDFFDVASSNERSLATAVHNLELGLRTPMGRLREAPAVSQFLRGAGLSDPQYAPLTAGPHNAGLLLAKRDKELV